MFGGSQGGNSTQIGGVRSVEKNMTGGHQTGSWWCRQAKVLTRPRSSKGKQHLGEQEGSHGGVEKLHTS